jgi:hypothetical protein
MTSRSTHLAPALRRSVRSVGQDVTVRPSTTPASMSVHGAWQIAATGFPRSKEGAHERDGLLVASELVGVADPTGEHQRVVVIGTCLGHRPVDRLNARGLEVVEPADLARLERDHLDTRTRLLKRGARLLELDPLEHLGSQNRHPLTLQLVRHVAFPFGGRSSSRPCPGGARGKPRADRARPRRSNGERQWTNRNRKRDGRGE